MKFKVLLVSVVMLCSAQLVYADCFEELGYDHDLYMIADKVALSGIAGQTFSMLANENFPTAEEKVAILKWGEKREVCSKSIEPPNNPIAQIGYEGFKAFQLLILDLYKGSMTYSQFARQRQEINNVMGARSQQMKAQYLQQMMQMQQNQQQQQQGMQQYCETNYQRCLDRASMSGANNYNLRKSQCDMENAGCQLGNALTR